MLVSFAYKALLDYVLSSPSHCSSLLLDVSNIQHKIRPSYLCSLILSFPLQPLPVAVQVITYLLLPLILHVSLSPPWLPHTLNQAQVFSVLHCPLPHWILFSVSYYFISPSVIPSIYSFIHIPIHLSVYSSFQPFTVHLSCVGHYVHHRRYNSERKEA